MSEPQFPINLTPATPAETPVPDARPPLIERVAKMEELFAKMASTHNEFAADVARELGLD